MAAPTPAVASSAHRVEWIEPGILYCRPPDPGGEAAVRAYYASMRKAIEQSRGAFVLISDNTAVTHFPSPLERKLHADLATEIQKIVGDRCVLAALVIASAIVRTAATAVLWVLRPSMPTETFGSLDEAKAKARLALAKAGR